MDVFRELVSFEKAEEMIKHSFVLKSNEIEEVASMAVGRVLAEEVISPINVPPFDRATVDGFAVRAEDTFGAEENNPVTMKLKGNANVGEISDLHGERRAAIQIVTGAPLPSKTNAVVMVENTTQRDNEVFVYKPVVKHENVMKTGSDIHRGETILKRGSVLSSRQIGVLAALGLSRIKIFRKPRVAIISTGAEIVEPGKTLPPGKIFDVNSHTLAAAVVESGGEPFNLGIVNDDDVELLTTILKKALRTSDLVITSGGVSVGPKDVVPRIINKLGPPGLLIHGVAVKPGKPIAVASTHGKPIFALPGHPTSSLLMFYLLVRPILLRMAGKCEKPLSTVTATTTARVFSARGRRTFITVSLARGENGKLLASPVSTGQSGAITTLANANGYIELTSTEQFVEAGEEVTVTLFKG